MIDREGFRLNVGIVLLNERGRLFFAKRTGHPNAWQFPQGEIQENESPEEALYRELSEEVGLSKEDVEILGCTRDWLSYRLPERFIRYYSLPLCIGQKQKWFLLRLLSNENKVSLDSAKEPEFDSFRWVSYWQPLKEVVSFKRSVYRRALLEFAPLHGRVFPRPSQISNA